MIGQRPGSPVAAFAVVVAVILAVMVVAWWAL
jgi:hypothetical protein